MIHLPFRFLLCEPKGPGTLGSSGKWQPTASHSPPRRLVEDASPWISAAHPGVSLIDTSTRGRASERKMSQATITWLLLKALLRELVKQRLGVMVTQQRTLDRTLGFMDLMMDSWTLVFPKSLGSMLTNSNSSSVYFKGWSFPPQSISNVWFPIIQCEINTALDEQLQSQLINHISCSVSKTFLKMTTRICSKYKFWLWGWHSNTVWQTIIREKMSQSEIEPQWLGLVWSEVILWQLALTLSQMLALTVGVDRFFESPWLDMLIPFTGAQIYFINWYHFSEENKDRFKSISLVIPRPLPKRNETGRPPGLVPFWANCKYVTF